ncbi:vacuolar import and degradation protein-domain-containing protein [Elsinoe ampelina]|uniref:Vacuolar import and degradation protein-domain-containing protein n=1 Tax=Elsinoe ampelina TaxID=302913 RepID=A0A6A6GKA3_9PEZI|nr:vacuolar import and degradation protein-domain-containing protein [Elsinoe ampelina]
MPPNNSPSNNPHPEGVQHAQTRPLTPLSYLSSPVPDLASTLVTQAEANAHDENLRFLRTPVEPLEPPTTSATTQTEYGDNSRHRRLARQLDQLTPSTRTSNGDQTETQGRHDRPQRDRMMRVLSRLTRFDESGRPRGGTTQPRQEETRRTSTADTARSVVDEVADLREIIEDLRRQNPSLAPEVANIMARSRLDRERDIEAVARNRIRDTQTSSQILSGLQRAEQEVQNLERRLQLTQRRLENSERHSDDLRSTAIMQHARTSATTTERMLRYIQQREQLGGNEHESQTTHDSSLLSRWTRLARGMDYNEADGDTAMTDAPPLREIDTLQPPDLWGPEPSLDRYRRNYITQSTPRHNTSKSNQTQVSPFLENAVKYLDRIRQCTTYDDALSAAIDNGFANKEFFADKHDDFLMDVGKCRPPFHSSWLQSGVRYSGSQHTTFQSATGRDVYQPYMPATVHPLDVTRPLHGQAGNVATNGSNARMRSSSQPVEHWPVKVVLHLVDEEKMTLAGTMEAYDVPSQGENSGEKKDTPITTFLEGQIIDLRTHSFLTPASPEKERRPWGHNTSVASPSMKINFPQTTAQVDAANWRRLPPFSDEKDDDEVARILLSHDRMADVNEKYIFMRWKERCFVHRKDDRCPISPQVRRTSVAAQLTSQPATTGSPDPSRSRRQEASSQNSLSPNPNLSSSRYVTESSFSQPIPRFPRPSQQDPPFPPPSLPPAPAPATTTPDLPAPPSTAPGPGPTIIAHVATPHQAMPPRADVHTRRRQILANAAAQYEAHTSTQPGTQSHGPPVPSTAAPGTINIPQELSRARAADTERAAQRAREQARSRPVTTIVLGEGDDTDTGHGLTISGFYYVSLCRETGELMGLYWDPGTSPYQCLRLTAEGRGVRGGWEFA